VRDASKAQRLLPGGAEFIVSDGNDPEAMAIAVRGVDAVVLTHGSHGGRGEAEKIDYGIVRTLIRALPDNHAHISLMTAIGVTVHDGTYNRTTRAHDWKRRSERLVRMSGHPYTIVRPGWFDYNDASDRHLVFLQGDQRRAGNSSDGVIARDEIARVLVAAITIPEAERKTLELIAEHGPEQDDLVPLFRRLQGDIPGAVDAVLDPDTLPLTNEPAQVLAELESVTGQF
jgi:uncharacterized protein YbjT (DUF2867 family)